MRSPQERAEGLDNFRVPKHRPFRFDVNGITFTSLLAAERHALFHGLRHPNDPTPKIYCRLARPTVRDQ